MSTNKVATLIRKTPQQALKVYWTNERYGEKFTATLCPEHTHWLYMVNPSAHGNGEYSPVECCDLCQKREVPPFHGHNL